MDEVSWSEEEDSHALVYMSGWVDGQFRENRIRRRCGATGLINPNFISIPYVFGADCTTLCSTLSTNRSNILQSAQYASYLKMFEHYYFKFVISINIFPFN